MFEFTIVGWEGVFFSLFFSTVIDRRGFHFLIVSLSLLDWSIFGGLLI